MGTNPRPKPARLAEKLVEIRTKLGLSQNGMIRRMGLVEELGQSDISAFELTRDDEKARPREPPLYVLLAYARAISKTGCGEFLEVLIDDRMNLPDELPANPAEAIKRGPGSKTVSESTHEPAKSTAKKKQKR